MSASLAMNQLMIVERLAPLVDGKRDSARTVVGTMRATNIFPVDEELKLRYELQNPGTTHVCYTLDGSITLKPGYVVITPRGDEYAIVATGPWEYNNTVCTEIALIRKED